jgi:hypothetical protein
MVSTKAARSVDLARVRQRLDQWRRTRAHPRSPIPTALWANAVALARQRGLYQTARALHLDYGGLKAHVAAADAAGRTCRPPAFVELSRSTLPDLSPCVIELTGPRGTVRLQVPGLALADLATLSRTLAGAE